MLLPLRHSAKSLAPALKRHIGDRDAIAKGLNGRDTFRLGGAKVTEAVSACEGAFLEHEFRPKGSQHRKNVKARLTGRFMGAGPWRWASPREASRWTTACNWVVWR
jgi:hypothetical protein